MEEQQEVEKRNFHSCHHKTLLQHLKLEHCKKNQKNRMIIRGLVFHPSGSCFFFKTWMGFQSWFPGKSLRKKCFLPGACCRWRYGTRCFKTQGTSAFEDQNIQRKFHDFFVPMDPGWWEKMPERWIAGLGRDFFWWPHMAVCQNLVPLVNIQIAGKWMFIAAK